MFTHVYSLMTSMMRDLVFMVSDSGPTTNAGVNMSLTMSGKTTMSW